MSNTLRESYEEIDKDLAGSWIELSNHVRVLATDLSKKATDTTVSADAAILAQQVTHLCDHIERIHIDIADFLGKLEAEAPLPDDLAPTDTRPDDGNPDKIKDEMLKIQRESHELKADFRDVLKALFMWRDDPSERTHKDKEPS